MGFHTFPIERADALDDPTRFKFCSREELLELLNPSPADSILDLGSGTGFYSAEIAPFVGSLFAIDIQAAMHHRHQRNGVPPNTTLITAAVSSLPFQDEQLNGAISVMTHHEYADSTSLAEIARILRPGARLISLDWSGTGLGTDGPPIEERYSPETIIQQLEEAGFVVSIVRERPETVLLSATVRK